MSVQGLGTDIVEIQRVVAACERSDALAKRVLTPVEMQLYLDNPQPARYLAKRWAAKEAAAKALGTGIGRGVSFQHIEITNDEFGAPVLNLFETAKQIADEKGVTSNWLSISDEQSYAVATVVLSI